MISQILKKMSSNIPAWSLVISVSLLAGCTGIDTFPKYARAGDTITVAVGSPEDMSSSNTSLTYTSSIDSIAVPLEIRSIFQLHPDKRSGVYDGGAEGLGRTLMYYSERELSQTVIVVDLPESLPVGPGVIDVTTSVRYPGGGLAAARDVPINLEIISGVGERSLFEFQALNNGFQLYGNLNYLEPRPYAFVRAARGVFGSSSKFGAIEATVRVNKSAGSEIQRIVLDDLLALSYENWDGNSFSQINDDLVTIRLISVNGLAIPQQMKFSIILKGGGTFISDPEMLDIRYFDIDGNELPDLDPLDTGSPLLYYQVGVFDGV